MTSDERSREDDQTTQDERSREDDQTTQGVSLKPALGNFGVWTGAPVSPEQAVEIEQLGYGTVWVGASPAADLAFVEPILEKTESLQVATGIVNIWTADAREVALAMSAFMRWVAENVPKYKVQSMLSLLRRGLGAPWRMS